MFFSEPEISGDQMKPQERNGFAESCHHAGFDSWFGGCERTEDV